MNFNFGTPKTIGGFTLGPQVSTPATPSLNFAAGDSKGLSITPQLGAKTPTLGASFGAAATPTASAPSYQFGSVPLASVPPALLFGGAATTPALNFAAPISTPSSLAAVPTLTGFSLGSSLGAPTSTPSLLSATSVTTASTLTLRPPVSATPTSNFNLGSTATTSSGTGFSSGGISSTGLTLGTPAPNGTISALEKLASIPSSQPSSTGLSLSTTTATATSLVGSSLATTTVAPTTGNLTFGQLEEALNKWTLELEDQGKMFINQALQLNAWDRLVIANGEKILSLNNGIEKVKQQQQQLDHELDFVLAQQRELEECIVPLEKELKDVPITDQDRNHTYQMAENMDTQLKQMSEDLKEIIEHLNESNKAEDSNDPVAQIGRILNAQDRKSVV